MPEETPFGDLPTPDPDATRGDHGPDASPTGERSGDWIGPYKLLEVIGEDGFGVVWLRSAAFSPDGTRVVTASDDKTARVWDASSGQEVAVLRGHEDWVRSAAFSPDGTRVVTASLYDKTARVWDSVPYRERFPSLDAARKAEARVRAKVQSRIAAGERVEAVRASAIADASISEVERRAYLIVTTELMEAARGKK